MPLNLYRRHSRTRGNCLAGFEPDFRSYETDELRRGWKKCHCPIYADGTLAGKFKRQNTKKISWPEAKAVASAWEAAGRWSDDSGRLGAPAPPVLVPAPAPESRHTTIERAVGAFLAEHQESSAPNTQKKYAIIMKKLKAHSAEKGYVMIDQWGPIDIREFRSSWQVSSATAAKNMSTIESLFEFALSNEWIARNPARLVKNPRGRTSTDARNEDRSPFSDDELKRMFEACETQYGKRPIRWARKTHHHQAKPGSQRTTSTSGLGKISRISSPFRSIPGCGYRTSPPFTSIGCSPMASVTYVQQKTAARSTPGSPNGCRIEFVFAP